MMESVGPVDIGDGAALPDLYPVEQVQESDATLGLS
jgi:hypothetical protein